MRFFVCITFCAYVFGVKLSECDTNNLFWCTLAHLLQLECFLLYFGGGGSCKRWTRCRYNLTCASMFGFRERHFFDLQVGRLHDWRRDASPCLFAGGRACLLACLRACVPACLPACLPACRLFAALSSVALFCLRPTFSRRIARRGDRCWDRRRLLDFLMLSSIQTWETRRQRQPKAKS